MQVQTVRVVSMTEVLSRLGLSEEQEHELILFYSETTDHCWGTNVYSLVWWDVFMDEIYACLVGLDYPAERLWESLAEICPPDIFTNDPPTFIDLES